MHCRSPWNGSYPKFVDAVKRRLNDPDSFEHGGSRASRVGADGYHEVTMLFRARNALGGMVRQRAVGRIASETCRAIVTRFE